MSLTYQANAPKALNPLVELTDKHRAILAALVYGLEGKSAAKHGLEPGQALSQHQAAEYFHVRRAYVRDLLAAPLFRDEMAKAIANKRLGYAPHALDRIAKAIDSIDDAIGLRASVAMLGETAKASAVNVTVNQQTNVLAGDIKPGYVLKLPADLVDNPTND